MRQPRSLETKGRYLIGPAAALAVGVLAVGAVKNLGCNGDSGVDITPGAAVEDIKISTAVPLIDVIGRSSVKASERAEILSKTIPLTEKSSETTLSGAVEIRAERGDIKLSSYKLKASKDKAKGEWGIRAEVNTDHLNMRPSLSTLFVNGRPQVSADQEIFGFSTPKGVAKRSAIADEAARIHFVSSCAKETLPTLEAGVKNYVQDAVKMSSVLPERLPGGDKEAELMRQMVENPKRSIKVTFTKGFKLPNGRIVQRSINPAEIDLKHYDTSISPPAVVAIPEEKKALDNLSHDDVKLEPGSSCKFSGRAAKKLYQLSGKNYSPGV